VRYFGDGGELLSVSDMFKFSLEKTSKQIFYLPGAA